MDRRGSFVLCLLVVLTFAACAMGQGDLCVVSPPACSGGAIPAAGETFYQALVAALGARGDIRVIERRELKAVLDELDLAAALAPDKAGAAYAAAARQVAAKRLMVPAVCKIESDYVLTLREITISNGTTRACAAVRTRVLGRFSACAENLVGQLLGEGPSVRPAAEPTGASAPASAAVEEVEMRCQDLRSRCRVMQAQRYFPALWQRSEAIYEKSQQAGTVEAADYYIALLQLLARAYCPPEGMVFVPGGYVEAGTASGKRQLWVEPFFIDHQETSVRQYLEFLAAAQSGRDHTSPNGLVPITINNKMFNAETNPATGINWEAAADYAKWRGKRLPTALEWMRAAGGGESGLYPCGSEENLSGCNLKGEADGFALLAPADGPGRDVTPFAVLGMTGNVREWTDTWTATNLYAECSAEAPQDPADGTMKIVKGGSWRSGREQSSISSSIACKPTEAFDDVGMRCAMPFFPSSTAAASDIPQETRSGTGPANEQATGEQR